MRTAPGIGFTYRPSRTLLVCAIVTVGLAVLAIALSGLPPALKWILIVCALGYGGFVCWRLVHPAVRALLWRGDGGVSITLSNRAGGTREALGELRDARVFGPLIVLSLRWPLRGRASLWLLHDNLDTDTRRRLRVRLSADGIESASGNADSV